MKNFLAAWALGLLAFAAFGATDITLDEYARSASKLIEPAKLSTLRERGANPRVQKYVALLADAKQHGIAPKKVAGRAVALAGMKGDAAKLTAKAMLRNLSIAEKLGCLNPDGLRDMQKGQAPTIQRGPCRGQELSVDHIIPRAVVPELDNVIGNLELMPVRLNEAKNSTVGDRQLDLARKLYKAGLLSKDGLRAIQQQPSSALKSLSTSPRSDISSAVVTATLCLAPGPLDKHYLACTLTGYAQRTAGDD